jgi:hypothetical protein
MPDRDVCHKVIMERLYCVLFSIDVAANYERHSA